MMTNETKFADRVALVTGSSSGIGAAIAKRLAKGGAQTVINYRGNADEADEVVAQIKKDGGQATAIQADMSDPEQIVRMFDEAQRAFGAVSLLVNNAAFLRDDMPMLQVDLAAYEKTFATNIRGPILSMVEFAKRLGDDTGGSAVVNISSGQARLPRPGSGLYASTKGAIDAATRAFATDMGPSGMRINALAPGATATDNLLNRVPEAEQKQAIARTPLRRLGTPEDIADVVAFLLSDDARWITGQIICVNGGIQ